MVDRFKHLLSPIRIGNVEIRNRILSSAHVTRLSFGGAPTDALIAYHVERAKGGIGLIITEASRVHPTSQPDSLSLVAWNRDNIPKYKALADAIHRHGTKVFAQLLHSGRTVNSADSRLPLWAPSPIWGGLYRETPHVMTKDEIKEVVEWWARCAGYMQEAGMDGVEIHAAHGYLIQQFLSPIANTRTDEYGGSLENRMRFGLEVLHAVRQAVGRDLVVGVRISADEFMPGGLTLEETSKFAQTLEATGEVDFLNVSHSNDIGLSFSTMIADMSWPHNAFVYLATGIKQAIKRTPVFTVCRIVDVAEAERVIAEGKADMVVMTRAHIADPEISRKLIEGMDWDIRPCIGCNQGCVGRSHAGRSVGCLVNAVAGRELEWGLNTITLVPVPKGVVVVGGGLAGMEAARMAALRGHLVVLCEKGGRLGGQINTLVKAPRRDEFSNIVMWLQLQLKKLGVVVKLNTEATVESIHEEGADTVIVATGSVPSLPEIPGVEEQGATALVSLEDVLERRVDIGKKAILLDDDGHHKASSGAEFLADCGAEVHLVTKSSTMCGEIIIDSYFPILTRLKEKRVVFHRETWCKEVRGKTVVLYDVYNNEEEMLEGVDTIVAVVPNRPVTELYDILKREGTIKEVVAVGDCVAPRRALEAIWEGHAAGRAV